MYAKIIIDVSLDRSVHSARCRVQSHNVKRLQSSYSVAHIKNNHYLTLSLSGAVFLRCCILKHFNAQNLTSLPFLSAF